MTEWNWNPLNDRIKRLKNDIIQFEISVINIRIAIIVKKDLLFT